MPTLHATNGRGALGVFANWSAWMPVVMVGLATVGSVGVLVAQVSVTNDVVSATRTCGSAFDAITDRSGWEVWWSRDLDEPDESVRSALVRTDLCPTAVNRRIILAALLAVLGLMSAVFAWSRPNDHRQVVGAELSRAGRLVRLGRSVSWVAAMLLIAGVVAIVVLVADADSTLFLYVDRLVVGIVGLIVLMPAIALFALGRALVLVGVELDRSADVEERPDA